jgi:hypothetical protein
MRFKHAMSGIAALMLAFPVCGSNVLLAQDRPHQDYRGGAWDSPPSEYSNDIGRRGFHDGIEGARKDFENHRKPDVKNRDEYRHPPVSGADRDQYRAAFRRGYDVGVEHLMNGSR